MPRGSGGVPTTQRGGRGVDLEWTRGRGIKIGQFGADNIQTLIDNRLALT